MEPYIIILAGPTASGKSACALDIAGEMGAVIINADSKQVYREIPLITAQPTADEQARVPHALYGVCPVKEHYTVMRWLAMVKGVIEEAWQGKKTPLLVGGTGLYIKSLMEGISPVPESDATIREKVKGIALEGGIYQRLEKEDPAMAQRLRPHDTQRVLRAYEVLLQTGKSLAWWQALPRVKLFPDAKMVLLFLSPPRQQVYDACNRRFEAMVTQGVIEEVKALHAMQLEKAEGLPAMKAHGVPELLQYIQGHITLKDAIRQAQQNTRNYIKRQYTWFAHQLVPYGRIEESHKDKQVKTIQSILAGVYGK